MTSTTSQSGEDQLVADRLAIIDLINFYGAVTDAKEWKRLQDFYTEDAVVWMNPTLSITGADEIIAYTTRMLGTEEITTYHHIASFTPVIDGDKAEAPVRLRAMHHGTGSRAGKFWESLALQTTHLVRKPEGWRCSGYEWKVVVGLGSLDLFAGLNNA